MRLAARLAGVLLIVFLVSLVGGAASACAQDPAGAAIEKLTGPSSRMEPDLRKLTDDIGGRITGSPGYDLSLQWGIDAFRRAFGHTPGCRPAE